MKIDFNFVVLFHLWVILQGLSTGFLLLFNKNSPLASRWLAALIFAMTMQTVDSFFISAGIYRDFNYLYFSPFFYSWAYGVLFYLYLQNLVNQQFVFKPKHYLLFIPVFVQFLFYSLISSQNLAFKTWFWIYVHKPYTRYIDVYGGILLVFGFLYLSYFNLKQIDFRRQRFILALSFFYLLAAIDPLVNHWYLPSRSPKFYLLEYILPIFTYWLSLWIYWLDKVQKKSQNKPPEISQNNLEKIIEILEIKQLYLNSELTLNDLSQAVNLTPALVSQSLNVGLGKSFNDFVNHYRVEAVKRKFRRGEHNQHTLLGIALDCGFNSKNTFNRAFKKNTGLSPTEYLQKELKLSPKL
ncbi:MAG: AraC family transcriptional regulator [Microscillaceae bacterium]|jgi:AraC-like DNA-binding protein|nr:AraC family transcriptional regulator [Microscillaceae bacterium]